DAAAEITSVNRDGEQQYEHERLAGMQAAAQRQTHLVAKREEQSSEQQQPWSDAPKCCVRREEEKCGSDCSAQKADQPPDLQAPVGEPPNVLPISEHARYGPGHQSHGVRSVGYYRRNACKH